MKIAITGPESTGKSTLAKGLALHFHTNYVPEFAREYLSNLNRNYHYDDLLMIAKGQMDWEEKYAQSAKNGLLFCDTDLYVLKVWSEHKYGMNHPWIEEQIQTQNYTAYFLTDIDFPWVEDPLREHPQLEMRTYFFGLYYHLLKDSGKPFFVLSGNEEKRLKEATEIIHSIRNQ